MRVWSHTRTLTILVSPTSGVRSQTRFPRHIASRRRGRRPAWPRHVVVAERRQAGEKAREELEGVLVDVQTQRLQRDAQATLPIRAGSFGLGEQGLDQQHVGVRLLGTGLAVEAVEELVYLRRLESIANFQVVDDEDGARGHVIAGIVGLVPESHLGKDDWNNAFSFFCVMRLSKLAHRAFERETNGLLHPS